MTSGNIIYADLSTYTPKLSVAFYEKVLGWKFYPNEGDYYAYLGDQLVAGLYETPERFKQMRMPHFWMTYIQVTDIAHTVAKARELGGIIEMEQTVPGFGQVALVRDPQGAGFTMYEGENLPVTRTQNEANTLVWNELHISNAQRVIPFYTGIFNWRFYPISHNYFEIYNSAGQHIADALEIPKADKGKYEYWVCTFGVNSLREVTSRILENGGKVISKEKERTLFTDHSAQAFFYAREV